MKLLKVFGVVVGIHLFALILIFANPGCSSTSQPPAATDTMTKTDAPTPTISVAGGNTNDAMVTASSTAFDPNAPAISMSAGIRYSPTRPNTPAAGALEAEPVADVTPASTYTVGKGDSLWTIAKKNHLAVSDLAAANNLKAGASVRAGQKLIVPGKAATKGTVAQKPADLPVATTPPPVAAARAPGDSVKHTVKAGETLGAIARKYQVKMGEIATANNIADPAKIRPGMELIIPGWQAPASKGGKTTAKAAAAPANQVVPTISVSEEPKPSADAPPIISVEDVPAPKK